MAARRVAIVLGAGPNVGTAVAKRFTSSGSYSVAVVSRSGAAVPASTAALSIAADFSDPGSIQGVFERVRKELGEPSVVIYNAAAHFRVSSDPITNTPLSTFTTHLAINTTSAFAAAHEAVKSFSAITDDGVPKAFIYTGNGLDVKPTSPLLTLGVGKAATAQIIAIGAQDYGEKGYGFYYADERTAEGGFAGQNIDGGAHAEHYFYLATQTKPLDWHQTFVKGKGYVKF